MNRKSVYSLVLAVALAVSFAFPVFADDLATDSDSVYPDADYYSNQLLMQPMALAASDYTVSQSAYYTLNGNNVYMGTSPTVPANASRFYRNYTFSGSNYASLLLEISGCNINNIESVQIEYSTSSGWVGNRTITDFRDYWVKLPNNANYAFEIPIGARSGYTVTLIFNLKANSPSFNLITYIYDNAVYQTLDGLYVGDTATKAKLYDIQLSSVQTPNSGFAILDQTNKTLGLRMLLDNDIWFYKGFEYSIVFNSYIPLEGLEFISSNQWLGSVANGYWGAKMEKSGNRYILTFTPTYNVLANSITFSMVHSYSNSVRWFLPNVYVESISSTYIPKSDSGSQGQTTAANTTIIKNVVTNISNTVSNISNQITTSTTTITNAVNNVANQVTGSINSQTNTLSDKIQGQTNTITNNQNQNTDKVIQNQKENTDKVIKNQDENTDKVVKNQDENTTKVTEKLEDVKTGIINGIIEGLKNLFIPSDDFFKSYFDDLYSWFGERLGFLSFPIDLLAELAEMFLGSSSTDCILTLPSFSISGFMLWEESTFNLTSFLNENFKFVLDAIKLGTSVILVFNFIHLCERKWEEVMMN